MHCQIFNMLNMSDSSTDVIVGHSTIPGAGLGLFAAKDIKSGSIVAHYDGVWIGSRSLPLRSACAKYRHPTKLTDYQYLSCASSKWQLTLDAHPDILRRYKIRSVAHMANDAIDLCATGFSNNCYLTDCCGGNGVIADKMTVRQLCRSMRVHIIAERDICCGEEIFVSYGLEYWVGRSEDTVMPRYTKEWIKVHERMLELIRKKLGSRRWVMDYYDGYEMADASYGRNLNVIVRYGVMNKISGEKREISLWTKRKCISPLRRRRVVKKRKCSS